MITTNFTLRQIILRRIQLKLRYNQLTLRITIYNSTAVEAVREIIKPAPISIEPAEHIIKPAYSRIKPAEIVSSYVPKYLRTCGN